MLELQPARKVEGALYLFKSGGLPARQLFMLMNNTDDMIETALYDRKA
jgi:hypothetical protein